jgi:hypothetical protein
LNCIIAGTPTVLYCTIVAGDENASKPKGSIQWVNAETAIKFEVK